MRILVNQSFDTQRVTGQQRYAAEISSRLGPDVRAVRPTGIWAGSKLRVWAWVQLVLPLLARGSVVLSMTSRTPLWARRQVVVVHDLFVLSHPEWYSRTYVWTHAPLLRAQIRTAAAVVAVSQPVADQVAALREDTVVVAPNAPSEVFSGGGDEPSSVLAASGVEPGSYFLAVGSRDPRKNLAGLAAAYSLLSEEERRAHPLVLVGGSASIYRDQDIVWPSGVVDVGYVDDEELRRLYRDSRTVVFVSLAEGFGLPLVEAAASGARSLLVSDIEVFRWICGDQARYVDPTSPSDVVRGMRSAIAEPGDHKLDLHRFSWDASAAEVARVCRRVAGTGNDRSPDSATSPLRTAVVLASAGRPELLDEALRTCAAQEGALFRTVVSVPDEASLPADRTLLDGVTVLTGTRGLAAQRNAALDALVDVDVVAFFDDDSVLRADYLAEALHFLDTHPDVVGLTGRVLLDGAVKGEVPRPVADAALSASVAEGRTGAWRRGRELYGCNFVVRVDRAPELRFDARLPLYSWLEDHDFARRLMRVGPLVKVDDCVIVHRAASSGGRQSHVRLGYSQVMNPVHLVRTGSFPLWLAAQQIMQRYPKNLLLSVGGPQASWRRERLKGNVMATADALRGRITPERIVELS